ncbi:MAG TPA: hypothetical protein ENI82_05830, partial [Bacteroidetes bacterium]|nr:hypothetical protein [Bacteroidota bacterium]
MKKYLKLFTIVMFLLSGIYATAQTCNYVGTVQGRDDDPTVLTVDLSCATGDITNVILNSYSIHSQYGATSYCSYGWYHTEVFVNGNYVGGGCDDVVMAIDFSQYAPITSLEFVSVDDDNFSDGVQMDVDADIEFSIGGGGGGAAAACNLDCPGDMVVYLDPGDCCWPAQYDARTEGDCNTHYDTILQGTPPPLLGFQAPFDPSGFDEYDPNTQAFPPNFDEEWTINGPASTYGPSMFDLSNLPSSIFMECYDDNSACSGNGDQAYWNYTMVNFIATEEGDLSFDWNYHTEDVDGAYWDDFGYMFNGVWGLNDIYDPFGADDQTGTFTLHMNAGDNLALYVRTLDFFSCGADVTLSNLVFGAAAVTDGIVLADGPYIGDPICDGETQTVKLYLLESSAIIDSCQFDITVHEYQNPTTTLACNDNVQISVDDQCVGMVTPDMILEGGPYGCYDDYTVQIFSSMPDNVTGAIGDIPNPAPLGNWVVGIYDETGNNCWSTITVLDKIPPTIECACPVGGEFPAGSVAPGSITGTFSEIDKTAALYSQCWDFGTGDQVPDHGNHYYDVYAINVSETGTYAFSGSDGNKMLIGIFDVPFNAVNVCANMIGGMGGYVLGSSGLFYEEPGGGNLDNTIELVANVTYYVVVSDFDADYLGGHAITIETPQGAEVTFAKTVYADDCELAGCYEDGVDYDFVLPEFADNCSANLTWTQTVREGEDCGTYVVTRHYTVTDGSGLTAECSSEYFFKGIDLTNMVWPSNFDDLPENNPMLECDGALPTPDVTGAPSGFNDACGTIEVFYNDQVYDLECGTKILRYWTVVDDCTGGVYEYIQVIRITDTTAPTFMAPEDITAKTKAYVCNSDIEVPAMMHLEDNCDAYPQWWVTTNGGTLVGDLNFNGFVDANETWYILNVPEGEYELCYHAIDNCGNQTDACVTVTVFDG